MVPKIHQRGSSFKGAAAYLLHDKERAQTSERVAWVETHNLATANPDLAWRIMAATSMDSGRLKEQAGIKNTGRKSKDHVLHLSLSWHPDEAEDLSPEEMIRAANGAIRALGASDRQAMIIAHNDEKQPHIHILANRVSPEDGRLLSSSKEKQNLSKWAQAYEEERGQVFCEQRVLNNKARDRGEFTRGEKDRPRHIFEAERQASNDNTPLPDQKQVFDGQKSKDIALAKQAREKKSKELEALIKLEDRYQEQMQGIKAKAEKQIGLIKREVRQKYRPEWEQLFREHQAGLKDFEKREDSALGRMSNAARSIDFGAILSGKERRQAISDAFGAFASSGSRLEQLKREHTRQEGSLERQQKQAEKEAASPALAARDSEISSLGARYMAERNQLALAQSMDGAAYRAKWKTRREQRSDAFEASAPTDELSHYLDLERGEQPVSRQTSEKGQADEHLDHYRDLMDGLESGDPGRSDDRER